MAESVSLHNAWAPAITLRIEPMKWRLKVSSSRAGRSILASLSPPVTSGLKNISFRVKNVSGKQLTRIQIQLVLPEMSQEGSPQIPFCYGCDPIEKQKGVTTGEEVQLTIPVGAVYPWVESRITENGRLSRTSKAQILVVFVGEADGTIWSSRCVKTADLNNACPSPSP